MSGRGSHIDRDGNCTFGIFKRNDPSFSGHLSEGDFCENYICILSSFHFDSGGNSCHIFWYLCFTWVRYHQIRSLKPLRFFEREKEKSVVKFFFGTRWSSDDGTKLSLSLLCDPTMCLVTSLIELEIERLWPRLLTLGAIFCLAHSGQPPKKTLSDQPEMRQCRQGPRLSISYLDLAVWYSLVFISISHIYNLHISKVWDGKLFIYKRWFFPEICELRQKSSTE